MLQRSYQAILFLMTRCRVRPNKEKKLHLIKCS